MNSWKTKTNLMMQALAISTFELKHEFEAEVEDQLSQTKMLVAAV